MGKRRKIVILGGGLGGLTTAWALAGPHNHEAEDLDITVLERGWTLGGKAASTRSSKPNYGERIEEHGIHLFLGFYVHAFRVLRDAYMYSGLDRDGTHPITCVEQAFLPQQMATTFELNRAPEHQRWDIAFPADNTARPWDWRGDEPPEISLQMLLHRATVWLLQVIEPEVGEELPFWLRLLRGIPDTVGLGWGMLRQEIADQLHEVAGEFTALTTGAFVADRRSHRLLKEKVEQIQEKFRQVTRGPNAYDDNSADLIAAERLSAIVDICMAAIVGIVAEGIVTDNKSFDDIDGEELREWLRRYGCSDHALNSPVLDVYYHLAFAYEDGSPDFSKRNTAAGASLRALLLMAFGYRGAFMYRMRLGMGETVVLPLYLALRRRGVKFRFFSDVEEMDVDGDTISAIRFRQQVELKQGADNYEPLARSSDGVLYWPDAPKYDQIVDGDVLARGSEAGVPYNLNSSVNSWTGGSEVTWRVGEEFDEVVLAIPPKALRSITPQLANADPRWKKMLDNIAAVPTRAAQLWFGETAERAGWKRVVRSGMKSAELAVATGLEAPFDTWVDMSHLLIEEEWKVNAKQASYLCSAAPFPDTLPNDEAAQLVLNEKTRDNTLRWLDTVGVRIWPDANEPGSSNFDRRFFIRHPETGEPDLGAGLYARINVDDSELYVQSLAGTTRFRLGPKEANFSNLTIAGDWTRNPLNVGCVEATVLSGVCAAKALGVDYIPVVWDDRLKSGSALGADVYDEELKRRRVDTPSDSEAGIYDFPRLAQPEMRPPYVMPRILQYMFAVPAEQRKMQELVDRRINSLLSSSVRYTVMGHHAFIQNQRTSDMHSTRDAFGAKSDQDELAFIVLVERQERDRSGGFVGTKGGLRYFCTILFNNCPQAMVSGREIFGFDKRPCESSSEDTDGFPVTWTTRATVYRQPDVVPDAVDIVTLRDESRRPKAPQKNLFSVMRWFLRYVRRDARADWRSLISDEIKMLNVRSTSDPTGSEALFRRELTECALGISLLAGVEGGALSENWSITVDETTAASLRSTLGIRVNEDRKVPLDGKGIWLRYSASMGHGRTLSTRNGAPPDA